MAPSTGLPWERTFALNPTVRVPGLGTAVISGCRPTFMLAYFFSSRIAITSRMEMPEYTIRRFTDLILWRPHRGLQGWRIRAERRPHEEECNQKHPAPFHRLDRSGCPKRPLS